MCRDGMKIWETPDTYFDDFFSRAADGWARSEFLFRNVVAARAEKVHLDVALIRYNEKANIFGASRCLWVITSKNGESAAEMCSSFAA